MDISSLSFLFVFLPVFLGAYLLAKPSRRLFLVSIANILFIAMGQYVSLLWLTGIALIGYAAGRLIESRRTRKLGVSGLLWLGAGITLALLLVFKLLQTYGPAPALKGIFPPISSSIVIPLGLSYVTFQIVSYMIDISRGLIPAEHNFVLFMAYVLFFPKLVSGPITRYKPFRDQIPSLDPTIDDISAGLRRVLMGVIKRVLVANQLAIVANAVFNLPDPNVKPLFAWLALVAFTLQIYFDFSGYTDIAIGLGRIIGITLPENFNYPYVTQSISDFWRRWHITLSTWFREYVFFPLERRRLRFAGQQINIIIVFLLVGLWHGPALTYLCWGLLQGLAIALESTGAGRWIRSLWRPFRHVYAIVIILLGWVFFRSPSMDFAFGFIARLLGNQAGLHPLPFNQTSPLPFIEPSFIIIAAAALVFSMPIFQIWNNLRSRWETSRTVLFFALQPVEDIALLGFFVLSIASQLAGSFQPNIYAKF